MSSKRQYCVNRASVVAAGLSILVGGVGCYTKTTYRRGLGKDAYQVDQASRSSISDSKTDPMVLSPPPKTRMPW